MDKIIIIVVLIGSIMLLGDLISKTNNAKIGLQNHLIERGLK